MPDMVYRIRILLSSPGNLQDDRDIVKRVVGEINLDNGQREGFYAEVIGWDTHTRPAAGEYPQAVINDQLPEDIDIFLGLMGARFGTSTKHWGSGTEEEFRIAYSNWEKTKRPEIMFYFSETMHQLGTIDLAQLEKRQAFKAEMPDLGVLYADYSDPIEFQFELRRHLSGAIRDALSKAKEQPETAILQGQPLRSLPHYAQLLVDEPLVAVEDLIVAAGRHLNKHTETMNSLTSDLTQFGKKLSRETKRLESAATTRASGKIVTTIHNEFKKYQMTLRSKIPKLRAELEASMVKGQRGVELIQSNDLEDKMPYDVMLSSMEGLGDSLEFVRGPVSSMLSAIEALPPMDLDFDLQKMRLIALHKDLDEYLVHSSVLIKKFVDVLQS